MAVTPWLQKKFDSDMNKIAIKKRLDNLFWQINPNYTESFLCFRNKLLWIVVEWNEDIILEELCKTEKSLKRLKWEYNVKLWSSIIEWAES